MVQTSPKHQENPSEYLIYRPLLQIMTNRPPCRCWDELRPAIVSWLWLPIGVSQPAAVSAQCKPCNAPQASITRINSQRERWRTYSPILHWHPIYSPCSTTELLLDSSVCGSIGQSVAFLFFHTMNTIPFPNFDIIHIFVLMQWNMSRENCLLAWRAMTGRFSSCQCLWWPLSFMMNGSGLAFYNYNSTFTLS